MRPCPSFTSSAASGTQLINTTGTTSCGEKIITRNGVATSAYPNPVSDDTNAATPMTRLISSTVSQSISPPSPISHSSHRVQRVCLSGESNSIVVCSVGLSTPSQQ